MSSAHTLTHDVLRTLRRWDRNARLNLCRLALRWLTSTATRDLAGREAARKQLRRSEHLIGRIIVDNMWRQVAIRSYQSGVATGFYSLNAEMTRSEGPDLQEMGESNQHLERLNALGVQHGRTFHGALYGRMVWGDE